MVDVIKIAMDRRMALTCEVLELERFIRTAEELLHAADRSHAPREGLRPGRAAGGDFAHARVAHA